MKTIKITRTGFPSVGNFSWMNYFRDVLSLKYDVIVDSKTPDIVFYSNLHFQEGEVDHYTGEPIRCLADYDDNVKKIFISGEARPGYTSHITDGVNRFALGYEHIEHERYLRFPTSVLDAYVLYSESGMFTTPFDWLLKSRDSESILSSKKHFCSVVQRSFNEDRDQLFTALEKKGHYIKSSGPWRCTISPEEELNMYKYHNYSNKEYMGKIDGLIYKDKINFFSNTVFNIAFQYHSDVDYLVQEKIIHAHAGDCIPLFYGNKYIEEEGFNPESFINCHNFNNFNEIAEHITHIYNDKTLLKKMYKSPIFINNKLPDYFNKEYLLAFFEKILS
jgi:hypothetical protein